MISFSLHQFNLLKIISLQNNVRVLSRFTSHRVELLSWLNFVVPELLLQSISSYQSPYIGFIFSVQIYDKIPYFSHFLSHQDQTINENNSPSWSL